MVSSFQCRLRVRQPGHGSDHPGPSGAYSFGFMAAACLHEDKA